VDILDPLSIGRKLIKFFLKNFKMHTYS